MARGSTLHTPVYSPGSPTSSAACECGPCIEQRKRIKRREKGSLLHPQISKTYALAFQTAPVLKRKLMTHNLSARTGFIVVGWLVVAGLAWKVGNAVTENKIYNPYEILGIAMVRTLSLLRSDLS